MYLNVHSFFSYKYGIYSPGVLIDFAVKNEQKRFVLTDINSTSGVLSFIDNATKKGVTPVVGVDFRNGVDQLYVAIAQDEVGYREINAYLSQYLHAQTEIPKDTPDWERVYVVYPFSKECLKLKLKSNEFVGISPKDLKDLKVQKWVCSNREKCVALFSSTFSNKNDFNTHRLLRSIDRNVLLSVLPEEEVADEKDLFLTPLELDKKYRGFEFLLEQAKRIIESSGISFSMENGTNNKHTFSEYLESDKELLRNLCEKGLLKRYNDVSEEVRMRLEKELDLITEKNFISYFLINWDMIQYARSKGYYYVGRGSGANSIVAYLLFITDVDPVDLDLYFERFINMYRVSPPDFDIDFSWNDRDDVTRYLFNKYDNVALLGTHVTFKEKGAVREIGKVLGLPSSEIEEICTEKSVLDERQSLVLRYAQRIMHKPNYLGIHAAGILITEKSIFSFSATSLPPKGYPTTHFDMKYAEDIGVHKFDVLSQRGLGKIKDALALVKNNYGEVSFDLRDMEFLKRDTRIKDLLRRGKTIGCFYVESPAMRMLLSKLEVDDYLGLVAASSIIRPGVAKSGMMREYILRHKNKERRKTGHPKLLEIMPETYGIMVYQEDVIKVAHYFAGLSLGEADVLRRGMSGKFRSRSEFQQVKDRFFTNCRERNYDNNDISEIWRQIESFAGYAFAKGHSASYAVESYQSLYLKAYFPVEYIVAILNNGGGFYSQELYIHEARMHGAIVESPSINESENRFLLRSNRIIIGFNSIAGLTKDSVKQILDDRVRLGVFLSLADFIDRVPIGLEQLLLLIRINAFREFGIPRKKLLWEAHFLLNKRKEQAPNQMFKSPVKEVILPDLEDDDDELAYEEIELIGYSLKSPFLLLEMPNENKVCVRDLKNKVTEIIEIVGYIVAIKRTKTSSGNTMSFGTFLDQEGQFLDTVHFPGSLKKNSFLGKGVYKLKGKVVEEFGFITLEVSEMSKLLFKKDPRFGE